ncbi:MAG: diaminohydroxyphosphoribosylaminopyrimidine deaminase, partial [Variibacter sp.]|nr:diaminohydroxyphosphoribosylaminopyrimidine deaminase [Variibacter sp.]
MTRGAAAPSGNTDTLDQHFMNIAFALGRRGLGRTWPNPSVGALVVQQSPDGPVIVGRGWTQNGGRPHAETEALRRAGAAARGATLYATLEPCSHHGKTPPCADAIIAAGISRVVIPMDDPNPQVAGRGAERLRAAGVTVDKGVGADEARSAHAGHIRRMRDGRPHVTLKIAVSADEKVGLAGRKPVAITGEQARAYVHMLRATNDAVVTGVGTVLADDPLLTCRLPGMHDRSPVRIVLDTNLRAPLTARLVDSSQQAPLWIVSGENAALEREAALRGHGADVLRAVAADGRLDLAAMLRLLAERGLTRVMVEAGPILSAAFVSADLVDEAVLLRGESK